MENEGYLRVYGQGDVLASDTAVFLTVLNRSYNSLCVLEYVATGRLFPLPDNPVLFYIEGEVKAIPQGNYLYKEDQLVLKQVELHSPGFWEFLGKINPLEVIRVYLNDRHERNKDCSYKNSAEEERLRLENILLKLDVVKKAVAVAREAGLNQDQITALVAEHAIAPLTYLTDIKGSRVIERAETTRPEEERELEGMDA